MAEQVPKEVDLETYSISDKLEQTPFYKEEIIETDLAFGSASKASDKDDNVGLDCFGCIVTRVECIWIQFITLVFVMIACFFVPIVLERAITEKYGKIGYHLCRFGSLVVGGALILIWKRKAFPHAFRGKIKIF